jgi:hypothetical protein
VHSCEVSYLYVYKKDIVHYTSGHIETRVSLSRSTAKEPTHISTSVCQATYEPTDVLHTDAKTCCLIDLFFTVCQTKLRLGKSQDFLLSNSDNVPVGRVYILRQGAARRQPSSLAINKYQDPLTFLHLALLWCILCF